MVILGDKMSAVDTAAESDLFRKVRDFLYEYRLAICCVLGPLVLGYATTNWVADVLMPLRHDKAVVNFALPNPDAELAAKIQKLKNEQAKKQKLLDDAKEKLNAATAPDKTKEETAVEKAQAAEASARSDLETAQGSLETDRKVAQSKQIADTLTARYNYAAMSGMLYLLSAATLLLGAGIVRHRSGWLLIAGLMASGALALVLSFTRTAYANGGRTLLFFLLEKADENKVMFQPLFDAYKANFQVSNAIEWIVRLNTFVGLVAVGVALLAFAVLAGPERESSFASLEERKTSLEERKTNLQQMIALSSGILVVSTFASKVLMDWPLSLIVAAQAEALKPLATALTSHLGLTGTMALFAAAAPALMGWSADVKGYRKASATGGQEQDADKLEFGLSSMVTSIIAILLPALTSPLFASFKAIIEMFAAGKGTA